MYQKEVKTVLSELKTSEKGLSHKEAEQRFHKYGPNELHAEVGVHPIKILIEQFMSPLVWILIFALAVSIFLNEHIDAIVIGAIVIINALLGFFQEYRAEKAIEALKRMASPKAKVIRNGQEIKIESRDVVPGDIIVLETGDKVPADARLLEVHNLETQEGPLTGESQPVRKNTDTLKDKTPLADRKNMVYSATVISGGRGKAIVVGTGMNSQVGKIAKLIQESHEKTTPLQKKLKQLGKYLTIAVIAVAVVVFLAGLLAGQDATEMFLAAIALAVAAIPEGLPAVITIALGIGVQRMIKRNALVRKLPSVETLGSVNVICTDKTGTLTHNQMTVTKIWANDAVYNVTGSGYEPEGQFLVNKKQAKVEHLSQLLTIGALCNDASLQKKKNKWEVLGDPTEAALVVSAKKSKIKIPTFERVDEVPFSSKRKMMTTIHKTSKGKVAYTKGAPDILIEKCTKIQIGNKVVRLTREKKKEILKHNEKFASEALRVLGMAYNPSFKKKEDAEKEMVFVGLQAMIDPPREEVKASIKKCQEAGIRVIMITGDQISTARAIAKELGIDGNAIEGKEISEKKLPSIIKHTSIFARVNPEHKLEIVKALKAQDNVVAMTGDGVNDAPALKKADIGVAMGITGTDVAKEAADMILTDDNFTSIVSAVEEGRGIFDNIRKFVNYLLSSNLGEIAAILFATLAGLPLPLTAIQILWVNLVTDGLPATALSLDPHADGIMKRKPLPAHESILSKQLRGDIIIFGVLMGIGTVILFWLYQGSGLLKAQTIAFTSLVLFEIIRLYTIREEFGLSILSNKLLIGAVVASIILHLGTIYTPAAKWFGTQPLALIDWGVMILASIILLVVYKVLDSLLRKYSSKWKVLQ